MRLDVQHELIRRFRRALADPELELASAPRRSPATDFTDPSHLAAERDALFRHRPVVAAFTADVLHPGDFLAADVDGVAVLVARGEDGRARVFRNACRHRGVRVAEGRGTVRQVFTCPFHAWSYRLDGSLHRQPMAEGCFDVDGESFALHELPSGETAGVILTRVDGEPFDVGATLGPLADDLEALDLAHHQHVETRVQERACNWKLILDTFLEAYHLTFLHKKSISPQYYASPVLFDGMAEHLRFLGVRRSIDELGDDPSQWSLLPHTTAHWMVFPNTLVVHQLDHIETWRVFPVGDDPGRTRIETSVYAPPGPLDDRGRAYCVRNLDYLLHVTNNEDFPQTEAAQRNLAADPSSSVVFGRNEAPLIHFHDQIDHAVLHLTRSGMQNRGPAPAARMPERGWLEAQPGIR